VIKYGKKNKKKNMFINQIPKRARKGKSKLFFGMRFSTTNQKNIRERNGNCKYGGKKKKKISGRDQK